MKNISAYFRTAVLAIMIFTVSGMNAQNSLHKQTEELYALYSRAARNTKTSNCLAIADTLRRKAIAAGNRKMETLALVIPMKHEYYKPNNIDGLEKALQPLMDLALKYNETEIFYNAVSHKVTYLMNCAEYRKALEYQDKMLKFAKQHRHNYGIIIGHISLGNMHRKQLQMVQAIDEYEQAIEEYKKYNIKHDLGIDYKRIIECYIIVWQFNDALKQIDKGLESSTYEPSISGLWGYKAFALFMLDRDSEFRTAYGKYKSYTNVNPDIMPFIGNCLEAMKLIDEGKGAEAEKKMEKTDMGAFRLFVEIAYNKRKNRLPNVLDAMQKLNISMYGNSKNSFIADWARLSSEITNNLNELDKQRAANRLSKLEITQTRLKIKNNDLEMAHLRSEESLALTNAENKRMSYNNQVLKAKRLNDSLLKQQMSRKVKEQELRANRIRYMVVLTMIAVITIMAYLYLQRNEKLTEKLKHTRKSLKDTLESLSKANDKAQEADRMKTKFVRNMSHEIRTPLNAIVGFSQVLSEMGEQMDMKERKEMAQIITNNSDILTTLINDILDLTSIESGKYLMKAQDVNVGEICRQAMKETEHRAEEGVKLVLDVKLPDDFSVITDRQRALQVLKNMLTNAMKNTAKGSITLSCCPDMQHAMLIFTVTDTGTGVPKDKQQAIFERFSKIEQFKQGAGLGLFICRTIAEKLGGNIDIDHEYEDGARFWFSLPIKK